MKRVLLGLLGVLVALVLGLVIVGAIWPRVAKAPDLKVDRSAERVAHGAYLANHVLACTRCHSEPALDVWSKPPKPDGLGAGYCLPEQSCFPNIGSHPVQGLGAWSDGEISRAVRVGVSRDGRALWTQMPYEAYRSLSDADTADVIAYLRSLPAYAKDAKWGSIPFPFSVFLAFVPQDLPGPVEAPDANDTVARGAYLVKVAHCAGCHSPKEPESDVDFREKFVAGRELSGGVLMHDGTMRSSNLTPDATGLAGRTREGFIAQFKAFATPEAQGLKVPEASNTYMPWLLYAGMSEADLGAIFDYLRTLPARPRVDAPDPGPEDG